MSQQYLLGALGSSRTAHDVLRTGFGTIEGL